MLDWNAAQARYEKASPLLLAMTNPVPPKAPATDNADWAKLRNHLEQRLMMARSWRFSWIEHYALIAQYLSPRRSLWLSNGGMDQPVPNSMVRGLPVNQAILDPTATYARDVCAAGMMEGLVSASRPWFKLGPGIRDFPLDRAGQLWYEDVEDRVYTVMAESNFYDAASLMFKDLVSYGTAPMLIYEDEEDIIRCQNPVVGEYYLLVGPSFRIEGFIRQYVLTVAQCVEQFGLENCSPDVQSMFRNQGSSNEREVVIAHMIEPNTAIQPPGESKPFGKIKGGYTWREVYWQYGIATPQPMSVRGFHELPFIAPRWQVNGNDPYGSDCPGMVALGDYMQLQQETRRKGELLEKLVRPPLNGSIELKNQPSSILPGHVTYSSDPTKKGMFPIFEVNPQGLPGITADIQLIQQRIKQGFFNDLFLMLATETKDMTAYEVAQRQQEKMQVLGPVIERFQNEGAGPAIRRILSILNRKHLLPPMPRSLMGVPMKIDYVSLLALAQKAVKTAGIERLADVTMKIAAAGKPDVMDKIDWDELIDEYADVLATSHKLLTDEAKLKQLKAVRQKQMQAAQQQAALQHTVPAVAGAVKDVGGLDVGGGINAAQLMLGGMSGSAAPSMPAGGGMQ